MSFILDALKKSESDRQRQTGPALFEVKVAPPKARFPFWALALAALLVINIAIGAWVFLRHPQPEPAGAPQAAVQPAAAAQQSAPPPQTVAPLAAPLPAPRAAAAVEPAPPAAPAATPESRPEPVLSGAESKAGAPNPDDYAPAVEPQRQRMDGAHVSSGTESGFKSYADAQANPDLHLPVLRVDLHVYAANPQERFVLINMRRLHEGDTLPEGGHLESITPEGVVVSYQGSKFFLEHE